MARRPYSNIVLPITLFVFFAAFLPSTEAAVISGTVTDSGSGEPIADAEANIYILVGSGSNCESYSAGSGQVINGSYTVSLAAGTYYFKAHVFSGNYFHEWWAAASSVRDCSGAESIIVGIEDITGRNFQLDKGASIAGTIYSRDTGGPITGVPITINLYTGDACSPTAVQEPTDRGVDTSTGTYVIDPLPAGAYYLQTYVQDESLFDEWWDTPYSRIDCARASPVVVSEGDVITGRDFQLLNLEPEPGNIDMNGSIDLADAILALQALTMMETSERIWIEGDANLDDEIGLAEVIFILDTLAAP